MTKLKTGGRPRQQPFKSKPQVLTLHPLQPVYAVGYNPSYSNRHNAEEVVMVNSTHFARKVPS